MVKEKSKKAKLKKLKSRPEEIKMPDKPGKSKMPVFEGLVILIFALSLYIRAVMPYESVFRNGLTLFASDDAVFHMRLVENTIQFFPTRIFYDAFTMYPYGYHLHWGPLFNQLIAFFSLVTGFGAPSGQTVNIIGAYFPAILGALVVFPVYYLGKIMFNRWAGLLAALLIAIFPGQFLSRSLLGFTDQHVAEVLFSTLTIMFLAFALKKAREVDFTLESVLNKDWKVVKAPLTFSILAGVMFGSYILTWTAGVLFAGIIGVFIIIQHIIDHLKGNSTEYLGLIGAVSFLTSFVMVLPYVDLANKFDSGHYSCLHVIATLGFAIVFVLLSAASLFMKRRYSNYYYPLAILGGVFAAFILLNALIPELYNTLIGNISFMIQGRTGGGLTIAEASPLTSEQALYNFGMNYYIAYIGIFLLGYLALKNFKPEHTLILVWSLVILSATLAQNRFLYYYVINVSLLSGFLLAEVSGQILKYGGLVELHQEFREKGIEFLKDIKSWNVLSVVFVLAILSYMVYPSLETTAIGTKDRAPAASWGGGDPSGGGYLEWLDALGWMRYNTPDPGMDYLAIYEKPKNSTYPYPDTAYGVMSWWDYGHVITYWGHRIPNANPFQAGIGGGASHAPGAATFLTAKTEEQANDVLYALGINGKPGARYVVSNAYMAYQIMATIAIWNEEYDYWTQIRTREGMQTVPSMKYYEVMEAKLHIFDGSGLKRYRLVHESQRNPYGDEQGYKNIYNVLYGGNIPVENSGLVKVFEFVKGAKITGRAPPDSTVTLTDTIKTNIGRTIQYSQTTTSSNGTYAFTVPYSTLGAIPGETQFDTMPTEPYTITAGSISKQIDISEKDVLEGNTVTLDL
jgi:dolichyl-diphosphooligosaccharide--protein glycosyltransferase